MGKIHYKWPFSIDYVSLPLEYWYIRSSSGMECPMVAPHGVAPPRHLGRPIPDLHRAAQPSPRRNTPSVLGKGDGRRCWGHLRHAEPNGSEQGDVYFRFVFLHVKNPNMSKGFSKLSKAENVPNVSKASLGSDGCGRFFSISKYTGHGGKMFFEDLRVLFTDKAPFPWSADKISSSKAISSASASAGVPGLWLW